jgi:ABC-type sugar transport system ATPase subunit
MTTVDTPVLEMRGIEKSFGSLLALNGIDFSVNEQEIVGLVGDNGAGKSTLVKTLVGLHDPDDGEILLNDESVTVDDPKNARQKGIATVYQDLALVDELSVAMNLHLGRPLMKRVGGVIPIVDWPSMNDNAERVLRENLNIHIDPESKVEFLSGGERQAVAICRALVTDPDVLVMDEPTSALSADAAERVMELIVSLRDRGLSIVIISHNLDEIFEITDRMTILSNGEHITTVDTNTVNREQVVQMMISETVPEGVVAATESEA